MSTWEFAVVAFGMLAVAGVLVFIIPLLVVMWRATRAAWRMSR